MYKLTLNSISGLNMIHSNYYTLNILFVISWMFSDIYVNLPKSDVNKL